MASFYKVEEKRVLFPTNEMFELLKPIAYGSTSDIFKVSLGNASCVIKKYNGLFKINQENIERKLDIDIPSYITPQKIVYVKNKFDGYVMPFCKGKDLEKRKLDISIAEFETSTDKLMTDTHKLSKLNYNIYDTFISNVMYDEGFKMVDTDDYPFVPTLSLDEIEHLNNLRLNQMLTDIFLKNANLGNLYFNNVEFKKFIKKCEDGEFLFKEMFDLLCGIAQNETNGELVKVSEVGKVLSKVKKI